MKKQERYPFGYADCESEVKLLKDRYSDLFFDETPFNEPAIRESSYLIIGRRGAGKTALAQYFSFHDDPDLGGSRCIEVDEPALYQEILLDLAGRRSPSSEVTIPQLTKVWEILLWNLIFRELSSESTLLAAACEVEDRGEAPSGFINLVLDAIRKLVIPAEDVARVLEEKVSGEDFSRAREAALEIAATTPIIIAIDTLEKYDIRNEAMMMALAALIQAAADFNLLYAPRRVHLKVFAAGEVFSHLKESKLLNPAKSVREPVYLLWRPRDLLRLISWRFYKFLEPRGLLKDKNKPDIDWEDPQEVLQRMWAPYFGARITNSRGLEEDTWPYVLRHTQMRPRQLILICNAIAQRSMDAKRFPDMSERDIRRGTGAAEVDLANEIVNSFSAVYPNAGRIVDALSGAPMLFDGRELDRRAKLTASEWPARSYSLMNFRQLVAEVGIVGRVRRENSVNGYIDADFEYSSTERLPLMDHDRCVVHPMFYRRLNVEFNEKVRVMPFSSHRVGEEDD